MISTLVEIQLIKHRNRWDFAFYDPDYERTLKLIENSSCDYYNLDNLVKSFKYGASIPANYTNDGILFIRAQNIRERGIDLSDICYISDKILNIDKYKLDIGDILITRSGVNVGNAAAITKNLVGSVHGSYSIKLSHLNIKVSPEYLCIAFNSSVIKTQITASKSRSAQPNINIVELKALRIPVPPLHIQEKITKEMEEAYAAQRHKLAQAQKLYQTIDNYVFSRLGISLENVEEKRRFLKPTAEMYKSRFDVDFNMGFHKFDPYINQVLPVKAVAKFPKRIRKLSNEAEAIFQYIDISSIDIQLGEIERAIEITEASAPSRARQVVHTGDIIVSTVRPTRGAIALIQNEMEGFICSTGFTIIHPTKKVSSAYLHLALRLSTTLEQFRRRSAGSSYPAILESDIQETLIPVPDKEVQNEIATEVTQRCNKAKSLHTQAENLVTEAKARVERMILGEEEVT